MNEELFHEINEKINEKIENEDAWITGLAHCQNRDCDYDWIAVMPMSSGLYAIVCPECEQHNADLIRIYSVHKDGIKIEALIQ
jgi:hypothetical protein